MNRAFIRHLREAVGYEDPNDSWEYEQWIGVLYACAVFRGVLTYPPPWLADEPAIGYVLRVDPLT